MTKKYKELQRKMKLTRTESTNKESTTLELLQENKEIIP